MGLALGTMPRTAGVKRGGFIAALATAIQVSAERCRTAVLNGKENAEMQPGQPGTVPFDEAVAMCADDICPETQVRLRPHPPLVLAQCVEQFWTQRYVAVAAALALTDMNEHAVAIDIRNLQLAQLTSRSMV
jgi:hypothetical protein